MIKLQALKDGLHSLAVDGKEYIVDSKGFIEIDEKHKEVAISHGFAVVVEEVEPKAKGKK